MQYLILLCDVAWGRRASFCASLSPAPLVQSIRGITAVLPENPKPLLSLTFSSSGRTLVQPLCAPADALWEVLHATSYLCPSSLSSYDHAFRLGYTAFLRGFGLPMRAKLRSKQFVRTFLPPGAPSGVFRPVRRGRSSADFSPSAALLGRKIAFR